MEIIQQVATKTYIATLIGAFNFGDHNEFRNVLHKMEDEAIQQVVIDIRQVESVDSAALGMLLLARDQAEKFKKKLVITQPLGQVKKMFHMAQFDQLFTISE